MSRSAAHSPPSEANHPVRFPDELPISSHVVPIAKAIFDHQVVIVSGETGSGKSTQLPKICLAMGRGVDARIGVTQPRRIAATSIAARIASELNVEVGREVGYKIRFSDRTGPLTYIKIMTDGILLAEMLSDPLLRAYDTLIIDEAHERSLNIDFLLGYLLQILPKRPDLRVIVSSATLETERFAKFFEGRIGPALPDKSRIDGTQSALRPKVPIITVSGRTFAVDVLHRPPRDEEGDLATHIANAIDEVTSMDPRGDILVFLPGEREIKEALDELTSRKLRHTVLLPLHGRLPQSEQQRVFQPLAGRRIVLATNVAETSLTIPGIVYVIDSGLARLNRYDTRTGVTRLKVETISRASADQRKGRAGRIEAGICLRLCEKQEDETRAAYTDPEILRVGLAGVILRMLSLGLGRLDHFPLLDAPPKRAIDEGYRVLEELSAIDDDGNLTEIGKKLSNLPLDPRIGRMLLAGADEGALAEVLVLASALGLSDPRERPLGHSQKADQIQRRFSDETSDFVGLLKLWAFWEQQRKLPQNQVRRNCRDNFLSWIRMREWDDIYRELSQFAREMGYKPNETPASGEAIHRALLPGLLSRIGVWMAEPKVYLGARQTRFWLHPASGLHKKPPAWVMAAELVETSKLYARNAARIEPAWIEQLAGPLARKRYTDPHWSERSAQVMAKEQITVYGLPVVRDRSTHFGPIDPKISRAIFIVHALVRHEYKSNASFFAHNENIFEQARALRGKARKSDMLADEELLTRFFEARIPDDVISGKTFEAFRKTFEEKNPTLLFLSLSDILGPEEQELNLEHYPDHLTLEGVRVGLTYKFDPSADDDGITVHLPLALLPQISPAKMEWTILAWLPEKLILLLESLPKALRKQVGPAKEVVGAVIGSLSPFNEPLRPALARAVFELTGVRIPPISFRMEELPHWFGFYFRIEDESGHLLAEGRDLSSLCDRFGQRARDLWTQHKLHPIERDGLLAYGIETLPERVNVTVGGLSLSGFPAIIDNESAVSVRVLASKAIAFETTLVGLRRLFLLQLSTTFTKLEQEVKAGRPGGPLFDRAKTQDHSASRQLVLRAVDSAFGLDDRKKALPRDRNSFNARLLDGKSRLPEELKRLGNLANEIGAELSRVETAVRGLIGKPGTRTALDDVERQLAYLIAPGCLRVYSIERLTSLPRYLRAILVRLERLQHGPQKDQSKAEKVLPFWKVWLEKRGDLLARGVPEEELDSYRWLVEEFRVSVFAPEVRTLGSISEQRLSEIWKSMAGGI